MTERSLTPDEIQQADAAYRQWWLSVLTLGLIPKPEPAGGRAMSTWCDPVDDHDPRQSHRQAQTAPDHRTGPGPKTRQQPVTYVTRISVPRLGDDGIQRLRSRMLPPGPEPEPEAGL